MTTTRYVRSITGSGNLPRAACPVCGDPNVARTPVGALCFVSGDRAYPFRSHDADACAAYRAYVAGIVEGTPEFDLQTDFEAAYVKAYGAAAYRAYVEATR